MKILKIYGYAFLIFFVISAFIFIPTFFFPGQDVDVPVYSKTTAREIARSLKEKGILHFILPFKVLAKFTHADRKLKAGLYRLNPTHELVGYPDHPFRGKKRTFGPEGSGGLHGRPNRERNWKK